MTIAIYIRVSTEEQAEQGYSIDVQRDRLISYCKSQGWDDHKLYIDDGYTGTKLDRPAMKRLIRDISEGKIKGVVVYKLDRLSRKQKDVLYLLEDVFEKHDVIFKSSTEPFDTSTPFGKAMIGVLAVFAQLERDMIVERTTSGRRQKVDEGNWYGGRVPFGYTWNKEAEMLEIIPEQAHIVKEVFDKYLQGQSRLAIAEWAAQRTHSRVIDHSTIRDYLERPIYMGKLANAGKLVKGKHEAIVSEETWYTVQLESAKRSEGMSPIGEYLLSGLLECSVCGSNIVHVNRVTRKEDREYSYMLYACKNQHIRQKDRNNNCSLGYQRREEVENLVISQIKDISLKPKKINEIIKAKTSELPDMALAGSLREKLRKITSGIENLYDAIQSGEIKASAISTRINKLEEERAAIDKQLEDLDDSTPRVQEPSNLYMLFRDIGQAWDYYTFEEQKIVIRKIITKITLNGKGTEPTITWNVIKP